MWPRLPQRFCKVPIHQYSNLTVSVVLRGATGESPTEGSGLSRGGNTGGTRSSEVVRRPSQAAGRRFLRGDRRPGRRTFRSLELRLSTGSGPPRRAYLSTRIALRPHLDRTPTALRPKAPFVLAFCELSWRLQDGNDAPFVDPRADSRPEQVVSNRPRVSLIPQIGRLTSTVAP